MSDLSKSGLGLLISFPPRMDLYIEKNMEIQYIFQNYASPDDILPYSIDERFIDSIYIFDS